MSDAARDERLEETVSQLGHLLREAQAAAAPAWLELELSMGQLRTIFALQTCGPTSLGCLAGRLKVGASSVSVVIEQLVGLGFVNRSVDAADRRRVALSVSDRGDDLLAHLRQARRQVLEEWLADLDDSELDGLCRGLRPLLRSMAAFGSTQPWDRPSREGTSSP